MRYQNPTPARAPCGPPVGWSVWTGRVAPSAGRADVRQRWTELIRRAVRPERVDRPGRAVPRQGPPSFVDDHVMEPTETQQVLHVRLATLVPGLPVMSIGP